MKPAKSYSRFRKTAFVAVFAALAAAGCALDQPFASFGNILGAPAEAKTATAAAGKPIEGDIDAAKALQFLYGNLQTTQGEEKTFGMLLSKEWALWKNPQCSNVKYNLRGVDSCPQEARVHSVFNAKYTEHGKEKYILLTKTGDAPNMENPDIFGAAVFVKGGGQWALEVENRYISPEAPTNETPGFGCFLDHADKPALARVGPDKHGILIHAMGTGGYGNSACPTVLLLDGGSIRSVLIGVFEYGYSPGFGEYGEGDAHASFDEKSSGEYYDAVVRYIDASNNGKAASRRFQFREGAYHKVATPKTGKKGSAKKRK